VSALAICESIAWVVCVGIVAGACLTAWRWWIDTQPGCSREEFEKVVAQMNVLTQSMTTINAEIQNVRSAVSFARGRTVG
jgi:predicted negative regulator of RcsB-dependent stress response